MIEYSLVSFFIGFNFVLYFFIHILLDYLMISQQDSTTSSRIKGENPPEWENKITMISTLIPTAYLWIIFLLVPVSGIMNQKVFYEWIFNIEPINTSLQILGIILIMIATIVACLGRISRSTRAISWGIPSILESKGMYRYLRHPLYASYCYYFIGFVLTFQSVLLLPLLIGIYGYYRTSVYEEMILVNHFGEEYIKYQKNTGRFFPRLIKR